jgi:hypothetical protein
MTKQIKIGFDKGSSRTVETDQVLVDIRGNLLLDEAGNFLYTKTNVELPGFFYARKAMSVVVNNTNGVSVALGGPLAIVEQFPELSEVSSSLLGVPRKNVQQSLLADVSIYGLDENIWEFYRNPSPYAPAEWINRFNNKHGKRFFPRIAEKADQQALAIEAFPTPWTFPFGPQFEDQGSRYDAVRFPLYLRFIEMGNDLYQLYNQLGQLYNQPGLSDFAEKYFLPPVDSNRGDGGGANLTLDRLDVEYSDDFELAMAHIERWTTTWMDIRDGRLEDPRESLSSSLKTITFSRVSEMLATQYSVSNTRPGYSSSSYYYAQIQSKEAFRYQPGAISGFTFGVKINFDETSTSNKIEWGCANNTDQYMFQVAGSRFNIVRRSTVPLSVEALVQNGLPAVPPIPSLSPNPFERPGSEALIGEADPTNELPRYETVIPQGLFNGDPLDGTGRSGYNISFEQVTMYKIEYSWYGAIGAKFYAYVPIGHGECRWVLLHTLIIENTLHYPSLRNPHLHFRYTMVINETEGLREPVFIYKYGASYYIDGIDEGAFTYNSYSKDVSEVVNTQSRPVIGFQTKQYIVNRDGVSIPNQKNFFIDNVTASSNKNVRIDVLECEGCRNGFGHYYSTSLVNGVRAPYNQFSLQNGSIVTFANTELSFSISDAGKKIIAPGIYSTYVYPDVEDLSKATIKRRIGATITNNIPVVSNFSIASSASINGEVVSLYDTSEDGLIFTGRLFGFDDVVASTTPIYKDNVDIRFLNPNSRESSSHFREFRIGVTPKEPSLDVDGNLVFDGEPLIQDNEIFLESAQFQAQKNASGIEVGEFDPRIGAVMSDDYRLPRPKGAYSGVCSTASVQVMNTEKDASYVNAHPETGNPGNFIVFEDDPNISVNGGEIGVLDSGGNRFIPARYLSENITFTSDVNTYTNPSTEVTTIYAAISAPLSSIPGGKIAFKVLQMTGRHVSKSAVQKFDVFPLYMFVSMHDNASVYNIAVIENDGTTSLSHTPAWLIGSNCNIEAIETGNPAPSSSIVDVIGTNEYLGTDGLFYMGGQSTQSSPPANFTDKNYLNAAFYDTQTSQPLRPGALKYTFFVGANETVDVDMKHLFGIDRYKITKGSFNNKSVYINSRVLDAGQTGTVDISILGKEQ